MGKKMGITKENVGIWDRGDKKANSRKQTERKQQCDEKEIRTAKLYIKNDLSII